MNTAIRTVLVFVAAFLVLSNAHNWLESPPSRNGNTDSTNKPCDPLDGEAKVQRVIPGQQVNVQWTTNHDGPHSLYFVSADQEDDLENSNTGKIADYPVQQATTVFTVPDVAPGRYVLQYRWAQYRNCVDMQVLVAPPAGAQEIEGQPGMFLLPDGKGTFDANTGTFYCADGYKEKDNDCVKKGMHPAGAFFLSLFIILIVAVLVLAGLIVARRMGKLPAAIEGPVGKVDDGITSVFRAAKGRLTGGSSASQQPPSSNIALQNHSSLPPQQPIHQSTPSQQYPAPPTPARNSAVQPARPVPPPRPAKPDYMV